MKEIKSKKRGRAKVRKRKREMEAAMIESMAECIVEKMKREAIRRTYEP